MNWPWSVTFASSSCWKANGSLCTLSRIEKTLMSDAATLEKPTLESLAIEVRQLKERLEDMEDLMELRAAVERNAGKPGTPWEKVKTELD